LQYGTEIVQISCNESPFVILKSVNPKFIAVKKLLFPILFLMLAWSCTPTQKTSTSKRQSSIKSDSVTYEITIIDPEFDHWFLLNYSPAKDHSNEYYRSKNQTGVSNWNNFFNRGKYQRVIEDYIYYEYSVDYGMEVNRKLYWYFKYVEETFKIRLLY